MKKLRVVGCHPSLTTVQQVWDQFWLVERKLATGWSYKDKRSTSEQSKLRHGLVGWILLKLQLQLPSVHSNRPGPYAHLWGAWSVPAMQEQLSCVETRLQATAASNRRNGPLGTLKRVLKDEFNALVKEADVRQPGKLLVQLPPRQPERLQGELPGHLSSRQLA